MSALKWAGLNMVGGRIMIHPPNLSLLILPFADSPF